MRTATAWDGIRPRIAVALTRAVVLTAALMMTAKAWEHTETDKQGGASVKGCAFSGDHMDRIKQNMIDAAEACFEAEPSATHDFWCTKLVPNEDQKTGVYQACTKPKREQRGTNGNKIKIAEGR